MTALPIHFSHGNGFPSESYQEYFNALQPEFAVSYLPMAGHHEKFPVTDNWPFLVQELLADIRSKHQAPIYGVGHSMGGVLMFMAACAAPEVFKKILLLDSPVPGRWRLQLLKLLKKTNFTNRIMPVDRVRGRRERFNNQEEAVDYFRHKALFKHFTDDSLRNYVRFGLIESPEGGYTLRFNREVEVSIYTSVPDNLYQLRQHLKVPAHLLYSKNSNVTTLHDRQAMARKYGIHVHQFMHGSHLFPFEFPKEAALATKKILLGEE